MRPLCAVDHNLLLFQVIDELALLGGGHSRAVVIRHLLDVFAAAVVVPVLLVIIRLPPLSTPRFVLIVVVMIGTDGVALAAH